MNKGLLALSLGVLLVSSLSCTKNAFKQDPYEKYSEDIKNSQRREDDTTPPASKPIRRDALHIDTAQKSYSFREGIKGEIVFTGRVLNPGVPFQLSIENLKDFPGATFDAAKGSFEWTPPRNFVAGNDSPRNMVLEVLITAQDTTVMTNTLAVDIFIGRSENEPIVESIDDLVTSPTREGEAKKFKVVVKDEDALDTDTGRPRILAVGNDRTSISPLISMMPSLSGAPNPVQDPNDPTKWIFEMYMDVTRGEYTTSVDLFKVSLIAVSRLGRTSVPKTVDAAIITSVREPTITWQGVVEMVAGQENTLTFSVFDAMNEGEVSLNWITRCDQLQGAGVCKCSAASSGMGLMCTISWKVDKAVSSGTLKDIEFELFNRSRAPGDSAAVRHVSKVTRKIRIISPAVPN